MSQASPAKMLRCDLSSKLSSPSVNEPKSSDRPCQPNRIHTLAPHLQAQAKAKARKAEGAAALICDGNEVLTTPEQTDAMRPQLLEQAETQAARTDFAQPTINGGNFPFLEQTKKLASHLMKQLEAKRRKESTTQLNTSSAAVSEPAPTKEPGHLVETSKSSRGEVVANTYEPAENIILRLSLTEALVCTMVCKSFKEVVETSIGLRKALRRTVRINDTPTTDKIFGSPVLPTCITQLSINTKHNDKLQKEEPDFLFVRVKLANLFAARQRFGVAREKQHGWRQTKRKPSEWFRLTQLPDDLIFDEEGIKLGGIVDAAEEMYEKRARRGGTFRSLTFAFYVGLKGLLGGEEDDE
ncbi:hypothetical protein LTR78_001244 [Recurvomyces mirabilis]|uniref:F-box domain-containing protein n=1 Tax=Recurvomyces mirabilis TaxID=574656 RepID=A0AAE0WV92_9PEZI|nr:hypothetical protein LTR78_001244 [Recurvomyces mirabilis]KAK5161220.1 hypothetical protein LTS14_001016 [Recurvomyces mirabilis]